MTQWPDLAALDLLVNVADGGSLSEAARRSGVAQPNASRTMARLERRLGVRLIHRATTGATVSAEGLLVVEWARATLDAARALEAGVSALRSQESAPLRVMASQTVAEHLLPVWIAAWQADAVSESVSVAVGNTTEVVNAARSGEIDLGFVEGPGAPPGLNSHVVARDDLVLVVAPTHSWARRAHITPDELAATPLVTREAGSGTRVALERALAPRRLMAPALALGSNAAVRVSVSAGTAPAVLSRLAVQDAVAAGTLAEVPVVGLDLRRDLRAVWPGPRRLPNRAAEALLTVVSRPVA